MGLTEKLPKNDKDVESVDKKLIISGVNVIFPCPIKPVLLNSKEKGLEEKDVAKDEESPRTPTCVESKIPCKSVCPPAPKKPKTSSKFLNRAASEFFKLPEEWETIFRRDVKEETKLT